MCAHSSVRKQLINPGLVLFVDIAESPKQIYSAKKKKERNSDVKRLKSHV